MSEPIDRRARIGHVQLTVSDLEAAVAFYSGVLGFEVTQRIGDAVVFLSTGGQDHIILKLDGAPDAATASDRPVGRNRFAIRYPDRPPLGQALRRLREART